MNASTVIYTITYDTPFASTPTVIVTPEAGTGLDDICAMIDLASSTAGSVRVALFFRSTGSFTGRNFHFVAIGPR